jgi:aspartate kinase
VDGVYTTDPRMVPTARRLDRLTFEEMLELAGQGSRVLHLRSVEFASRYGVRLRVLSSFRPEAPGTLITSEESDVEAPVVAGVAFNRDEAEITVRGVPDGADVAWRLLEPVSAAHIEVDMIVASASRDGCVDFSFTVNRDDHRRALELVRKAVEGQSGVVVDGDATVAKLSAVGVGMRSHAGVATRLFAALAREGIAVRLVSTSEIKISVLVAESAIERAVRAVHDEFGLGTSA